MAVYFGDVEEGCLVMVKQDFGMGRTVLAKVDAVLDNVKNGRPGIDYIEMDTGNLKWAYADQIVKLVAWSA
jgi:hypothetical protein